MNRKAIKKRRLELLDEQARIDKQRCIKCNGDLRRETDGRIPPENYKCDCPAAIRIREIGAELDGLSGYKRKPPEKLNVEAYHLLKDWGWETQQIRKHYGISLHDFRFWMQSNGLLRKQKEGPEVVVKPNEKLTVELYRDLKAKGVSDANIGKQFDMKPHQIQYWRKQNDLLSVRGMKQQRIEAIAGKTKAEKKGGVTLTKAEEREARQIAEGILADSNKGASIQSISVEDKSQSLYDHINDLTKQLERSKESNRELSAENKALRDEVEMLRPLAVEDEEEAIDWRKKYENEHLRFLEANAVIMDQKELHRDAIQEINEAWDDDIEVTKKELQEVRQQNAYLTAEMQAMKKQKEIHDEFKIKAVQQVQKKNKFIHAMMDYCREEA